MSEKTATHLLVLYDPDGNITTVGEINQDELDGEQVRAEAPGRHFAQIPLTAESLELTHEQVMSDYVIEHESGRDARLRPRSAG